MSEFKALKINWLTIIHNIKRIKFMKKTIALIMFLSMVNIVTCFACPSPPCDGPSSGGSSGGNSSSENNTDTTVVRTKYSVSAAEAAATDGDTNSVSWTFE